MRSSCNAGEICLARGTATRTLNSLRAPGVTCRAVHPVSPAPRAALEISTRAALRHSSRHSLILPVLAGSTRSPASSWPLRRQIRRAFADSLAAISLPSSVAILDVSLRSSYYEHGHRLPNLVGPDEHDPLCSAIRRLVGPNVQRFDYRGQIDASLFWPQERGEGLLPPWPALQYLNVQFDARSPSGRWYFKGDPRDAHNVPASDEPLPTGSRELWPPGYGSEAEARVALDFERSLRRPDDHAGFVDGDDKFRRLPDDITVGPMLVAFAQALAQMPNIQSAYLMTELADQSGEWFISYGRPGYACGFEQYVTGHDTPLSRARVFLHVEDWRPNYNIIQLFRRAGNAHTVVRMPSLPFCPSYTS